MKKFTLLMIVALAMLITGHSYSQVSITSLNTDYLIDFDSTFSGINEAGYRGLGFLQTPTDGQADADGWAVFGLADGTKDFGTEQTGNDFGKGVSSGGVTSGGLYSFIVGTDDTAFGVQPTGSDFTPGTFTIKLTNNTGSTITSIDVDYNLMVLNNASRANSFNFLYSSDHVTYTQVAALDYTSPLAADGSPSWIEVGKNTTITGISVANNDNFYIRWESDDESGSGSRDEFAIDDIVINAAGGAANPATQLEIISINNNDPVYATLPFEIIVQSQDLNGVPANVSSDESVTISLQTGSHTLSGTLSGIILSGTNEVVISGVTYSQGESGVVIRATGGTLGTDDSDPFDVETITTVANLAALRAGTLDDAYHLTGEVILTFQQSFRNQK
jgi:hypothetical protein